MKKQATHTEQKLLKLEFNITLLKKTEQLIKENESYQKQVLILNQIKVIRNKFSY